MVTVSPVKKTSPEGQISILALYVRLRPLPRIHDSRDRIPADLLCNRQLRIDETTKLPSPPSSPQSQLNTDIMLSGRAILSATRAAAPSRVIGPRVLASSQIRSYATPATADVRPPVALYGLDGTYATALVRSYLPVIYCSPARG
jgi:hypothetical protein